MQKLTKAEEEVMQLIWQLERCLVSDILEKMGEPKPPHSTISSVVRILEKKGYVGHKAYGKTYEYFPVIDREAYAKRSLHDVLNNYFDGSARRLVSHLMEDKQLDEQDLEDLLKKLE